MTHPYQVLTPSVVLDALSGLGLAVDGRLSALGSYENRVYLAHLDDDSSVVAKFYRPARWSEAQIREEMTNICRCGTYNRVIAGIQRAAGISTSG